MPTYNYSDEEIRKNVGSGKDAERARKADTLMSKATQPPHDDDAQALQQLIRLGGDDSTGGFATNDARNYVRMLLAKAGGPQMEYSEQRDGGGFLGSLGDVLKVAAPIAGMAIPGVGMLGAGLIGAGGSAAGGMLKGEGFNPLKTLAAGGAAAAGNKLLGNGLGSGVSNTMFGSGPKIPGAPDIRAMGDQGHTPTGKPYDPTAPVAGAAGRPGGSDGGVLGKLGSVPWDKIGAGAAGLGSMIANRQQNGAAADFANAQLELKKRQLDMAEKDYASRAPLRNMAISRLGQMASKPMGSSIYGRA